MRTSIDLTAAIKAVYDACKAQLEGQGTWQDTDDAILGQYASSAVRASEYRKAAEAEPWVEGSKKQLVPHPAFKISRDLELDALKYATALLLTPKARKSAGLTNIDGSEDELEQLLAE